MNDQLFPSRVEPKSPTEILFEWTNGEQFAVPYADLRFLCPCAGCVDEHTGQRTITRESVAADIRVTGAQVVGRYALQIGWSDKHNTGIYPFEKLHAICQRHGLLLRGTKTG